MWAPCCVFKCFWPGSCRFLCVCVCVWLSVSAIRPALFCSAEWLCMALQFCTPIVCTTTGYPNIPWLMLDHSGPLLPVPTSYLGTMDMYTVSSFLLRSARHLHRCTHARTHERTDFTCTRLLPCRPREPRADEPLAGGLSFACQSAVLYVLRCCCAGPALHPVSAYQWPPSALPACLSACLPACPPARLARARQKIIISRLPGTLYDTMLLPADPPHAGLSTWRPRYGLYGRSDSKGRQPSRDAHTRQCHPCPLLPPRAPFTR